MPVQDLKETWLLLLLFISIGCSTGLENNETFSQEKSENDSFLCEKVTDARLGGRGVPGWQRAYEECMIASGQ